MLRTTLPRLLACCIALGFLATVATLRAVEAPAKSLIRATDLLKLKQLESVALSPDGKWAVYVVRSIEPDPDPAAKDPKENWVYHTNLWLIATDGQSEPRQLTRGKNATAPTWSPQGDRIAFVRSADKEKPQIHILPISGGEAVAITKIDTGASSPRWSPDGTRILFTSSLSYGEARAALEKSGANAKPSWDVERPGRTANDTKNYRAPKKPASIEKPDAESSTAVVAKADGTLAERREWLAKNEADGNPRALTRLNFLTEMDANAELSFTHLFIQEAREGAEAKDLTPGFVSYNSAEWMTDGEHIICAGSADLSVHPDRVTRSSLYAVDARQGGAKTFLNVDGHSVASPQPSPDGRWVAFTIVTGQQFGYEQPAVAIVPANGGETKILTASLDRASANLQWTDDSNSIYFTAPDRGRFPLFRFDLTRHELTTVTSQSGWGIRDFALGATQLLQIVTHPENPSELQLASLDGKVSRPITKHNSAWIAERRLSAVEAHQVRSGNFDVDYWIVKPTALENGEKYPLLLEIHGGPSAMWGPGEESMWFEFQYFAAQGYTVVFANPRGSGGYGKAFQQANYRDWGAGPASDALAAASEAAKLPFVDAARQVVTGGSYGGYLTAWIVGHDQRFQAAVAQRGVYDLATFFGEGNAWRLVPLAWGGLPWERGIREILIEQSPLTFVENIKTPLLIQHGDNDRRTGFVQSEMLLKSLKHLGRPVESVRYPRATHEMSRSGEPKQRLDSLVRYEEFFRRYIGEN